MNPDYESLMKQAIQLALRGKYKVCPNPCVGAILIKDNQILGEGWHKKFGAPHAEIECLANVEENGFSPHNATMIVTLEPCNHFGKTPPCSDALIKAGIKKLVYGFRDPNNIASGGLEKLAKNGIEVVGPVCERECKNLVDDFIVWQTADRPYILLKLASTLDGKIATRIGHSQWISSEKSRLKVQELRYAISQCHGAILIGGGTFRADNPKLTVRLFDQECGSQPLACVLTSRLPKKDADFFLLKECPERTVFFASPAASASTTAEGLRQIGCKVFAVGQSPNGGLDFSTMFKILRNDLECLYVICEGGGHLALSLLEENYVDEFHLHLAPLILGDNSAIPLFSGRNPLELEESIKMKYESANIYGGDAHLILRPRRD